MKEQHEILIQKAWETSLEWLKENRDVTNPLVFTQRPGGPIEENLMGLPLKGTSVERTKGMVRATLKKLVREGYDAIVFVYQGFLLPGEALERTPEEKNRQIIELPRVIRLIFLSPEGEWYWHAPINSDWSVDETQRKAILVNEGEFSGFWSSALAPLTN